MEATEQTLSRLLATYGLDAPLVAIGGLLLFAMLLHLLLGVLLRRLHRVAKTSSNRWDDVVITALETPLRVALWVIALMLILGRVSIAADVQAFILRAYDTLLILMLAWFLQRLIFGAEEELLSPARGHKASTDKAAVRSTAKLIRVILWILAGLMALQSVGVSISGLLAFGGIGGIAVGFAAKDLMANFFGGMSIYLDRPFTPGDWIRSPDREIEGTVEDIGWRLTRIRTFDQRPLYVPNAVFTQIAVENPSRMFNRRIYETIGVRYQDSAKLASIVADVRQMLEEHPEIDLNRTLIVNFVSFGPSSLDFFVYAFTRTTVWVEYHAIKQDVLLKILDIIHEHGADVAFPTRTLHLDSAPPELAQAVRGEHS